MKLSNAIELFVMAQSTSLAPSTLSDYERYLRLWLARSEDKELQEYTPEDLQFFMGYMHNDYKTRLGGPLSQSGLRNCWCALRTFWRWASERRTKEKDKVENIALELQKPSVPAPVVEPFSREEVTKLLDHCEYTSRAVTDKRRGFRMSRPEASRDIAIIYLLLDTGMRVSELSRLNVEDVHFDSREVAVKPYRSGLKSRARVLPIAPRTGAMLMEWIIQRREIYGDERLPGAIPLFCSVVAHHGRAPGKRLKRRGIHSMLARVGERAGVDNVHPHRFRHTFAIEYLRGGGDPWTLQMLLGHSSMEMVRRYLHLIQRDVANTHHRASAVNQWGL